MPESTPHASEADVQRPRKSPWHLVFLPVAFAGGGVFCYACVRWVCAIAGFLGGSASFEGMTERAKIFIVMPLLFASIPAGFLVSNLMIWTISPLRRFFVGEAAERKLGNFAAANVGLLKLAVLGIPPLFFAALAAALW